jgi:hypothetical protein
MMSMVSTVSGLMMMTRTSPVIHPRRDVRGYRNRARKMRTTPFASSDDAAGSDEVGGSGGSGGLGPGVRARAAFVLKDSKTRLALPGNETPAVGERPFSDVIFGFGFCGLTFAALGLADEWVRATLGGVAPFMIGSWASLAVLAFGTMDPPPLRLWNLTVSTSASACIGIACVHALGATWVARALALSASLAFMMRLGAIHPPAGAVAMAAVDIPAFAALRYGYIVYPGLIGAFFILFMSKACQAMKRRYEFEFGDVARALSKR